MNDEIEMVQLPIQRNAEIETVQLPIQMKEIPAIFIQRAVVSSVGVMVRIAFGESFGEDIKDTSFRSAVILHPNDALAVAQIIVQEANRAINAMKIMTNHEGPQATNPITVN